MVHIVQVVLAGSAEAPRLFTDPSRAEAAFVEAAKTYWKQSYAAWCEKEGADCDSFAAAQGFVASFDLADRSRIHYWSLAPEDVDSAAGAGLSAERREQIGQLVTGMERAADVVRSGMDELRAIFGAKEEADTDTAEESEQPGETSRQTASSPPETMPFSDPFPGAFPGMASAASQAEARKLPATPKAAEEQFQTKEWKDYVNSIMLMCGGLRSEYHLFKRADWRHAVYHDETDFEYWDWVAYQIDEHIERAQEAGYSVIDDPDNPGNYRFKTPDGEVSDISVGREGEAWCRAGLHLAGG